MLLWFFGVDFFFRFVLELVKLKKEEFVEVWSKFEEIVKVCFVRWFNYNDLILVFFEMGIFEELFVCCGLMLYVLL